MNGALLRLASHGEPSKSITPMPSSKGTFSLLELAEVVEKDVACQAWLVQTIKRIMSCRGLASTIKAMDPKMLVILLAEHWVALNSEKKAMEKVFPVPTPDLKINAMGLVPIPVAFLVWTDWLCCTFPDAFTVYNLRKSILSFKEYPDHYYTIMHLKEEEASRIAMFVSFLLVDNVYPPVPKDFEPGKTTYTRHVLWKGWLEVRGWLGARAV